jgi:hydrogenase expression/formation protein HypE
MTPLSCPFPFDDYPYITLAHGGGGRLMHRLIDDLFADVFHNPQLRTDHDGAILPASSRPLAFTTDSHVVSPLFFPGGDIGTLAVCGTVNDLAMCGARPLALSVGFILEEGLSTRDLRNVAASMRRMADVAGVSIVTGDTKVVEKGHGDGLYINTSGIGEVLCDPPPGPERLQAGDAVILSGDVGRHGVAVMAAREGLNFRTTLESDCAPLNSVVTELAEAGFDLHAMRDLTRGGLATALVELLDAASLSLEFEEETVPLSPEVRSACELLGLDPLYVANEGRFVVILPAEQAENALEVLRRHPVSEQACLLGTLQATDGLPLTARTAMGTRRVLSLLSGEQLPRIC